MYYYIDYYVIRLNLQGWHTEAARSKIAQLILDLDAAPEIAAMFGIDGPAPWLLVMREQVVLYREPLSAKPPAETRALIDRAAGLDMAAVHDAVAARRRALDSLHMRRVCPTALRGPGPG